MKYLKKFASIALALIMVMALCAPAFADDPPTSNLAQTEGTGHKYTVYQVLTGTAATGGGALAEESIAWDPDIDSDAIIAALKAETFVSKNKVQNDTLFDNVVTAQDFANVLADNFLETKPYNTVDNLTKLARIIYSSGVTDGTPAHVIGGEGLQRIQYGYVVAKEEVGENDQNPSYHLKMVASATTTFSTKQGDSTVSKEIMKKKGQATDPEVWVNGAVYKESDEIPFRLVVSLPDNLKDTSVYNSTYSYDIVLHDVLSAGFALEELKITSVSLYNKDANIDTAAANATLASGTGTNGTTYKMTKGTCSNTGDDAVEGCSFEIKVDKLQNNENAQGGGKLVVEYTVPFSADVVNGLAGNENKVTLFERNENKGTDGAKAYQIVLEINKVNGNGDPLVGAEFTLFKAKKDPTDNTKWVPDGEGAKLDMNGDDVTIGEGDAAVTWPEGTRFSYTGLEAGTYILRETKHPDGYNQIDDIVFTVSADANEVPELSVEITYDSSDKLGVSDNMEVGATIENLSGIKLPETGGIGTTIFYIVGGVLVVGAVVLLISKRRTSVDDE